MAKNKTCPACGAALALGARFCNRCGAAVPAGRPKKRAGKGALITLGSLWAAALVLGSFALNTLLGARAVQPSSVGPSHAAGASAPSGLGGASTVDAADEVDEWAGYPFAFEQSNCVEDANGYIYWALGGKIRRMNRDGGEVQLMVDMGALVQHAIDSGQLPDYFDLYTRNTSIAVLDGWLYFSCAIDETDRYAWYRVPLAGGQAEYLFSGRFSYMQVWEGSLYMLVKYITASNDRESFSYYLAKYTPESDTIPQSTIIETVPVPYRSFYGDFNIHDGVVYYQYKETDGAPTGIKTYSLATGELGTVFDPGEYGGVYCIGGFLQQDIQYSVQRLDAHSNTYGIRKQNIATGEHEIILGMQDARARIGVVPLAGRLVYSTAIDDDTGTFTYAVTPFGDEQNILQTFTATAPIRQTFGPWALWENCLLDGRTGEVTPFDESAPLCSLDDLLPAYQRAVELSVSLDETPVAGPFWSF